jgi:excisionase family DNA binding protein
MQPEEQTKSLWRYSDLANYLGVSEAKLRRDVMARVLPFKKIGRMVRFSKTDIDEWLKSCTHLPEE